MKRRINKVVALFVFTLIGSMVAFAQNPSNLNSQQLTLRNQIQSYLKSEGFQPTIDDDGDIMFKRQGGTYYVRVNANDDDPMYVSMSRYFNYTDDITKTKLILYNADNDYKMCKIIPLDNSFTVKCEMFITNSTAFTSVFYRMVRVMEDVVDQLKKM